MEEVLLVSSKSDSLSSLPVDEEDCDSFWNSSKTGKANFFSSKKDNSKNILGTKIVICYYLLLSLLRKNPEKRLVVIYVISDSDPNSNLLLFISIFLKKCIISKVK